MYLSATLHLSDSVTLQRIYYTFEPAIGTGQFHSDNNIGNSLVDGWLTSLNILLTYSSGYTQTTQQILGFGIKTNPTEMLGNLDVSEGLQYDHPFENYLTQIYDSVVYHGSSRLMPLYFLMLPPQTSLNQIIDSPIMMKKIFRRGLRANDDIQFYVNSSSMEGTADAGSAGVMHVELENVIAPNNWK